MSRMHFHTTIQRNKETIYALLTNLRGYPSWLPASSMYAEMQEISDYPIQLGTTYVDKGTTSVMHGQVTALEPAQRITFVQTMSRNLVGLSGGLHIQVSYMLKASGELSTQVTRDVTIKAHGVFVVLQPVLLGAIRKENKRILQRLKWYLEAR